jgi:hypothetical protein
VDPSEALIALVASESGDPRNQELSVGRVDVEIVGMTAEVGVDETAEVDLVEDHVVRIRYPEEMKKEPEEQDHEEKCRR